MASKKPKMRKTGKKPSRNASLEVKQNWLKRKESAEADYKKAIREWEASKKKSKELDKKIYSRG